VNHQPYEHSPLASVACVPAGELWTLVLSRDLPHPVERIWSTLTDPDLLRQWAPYTADRPLTSPGEARLAQLSEDGETVDEGDGTVTEASEPRVLEHAWGDDRLRWELAPSGTGSALTLRHTFASQMLAAATAAGWHICLDVLDAQLSGEPFGPVVGTRAKEYGWDDLNRRYSHELGVSPSDAW
jgi:uncharacterized protein YndB with AHSA1/START domain